MLKGVASSILGENTADNSAPKESQNASPFSNLGINQDELNMMLKAKSIFEKMNSGSSKNADLIMALKPHLSESSREKADQAIRILRLFEALPYIKELF